MEEETVDCFEAPFRFRPERNKENHQREHETTGTAILSRVRGSVTNNTGFWIGWIYWHFFTITIKDRAIAEAVSRWFPTAADRVRARVCQMGFVVEKVASGQVFSEYFGFPCQYRSFHQLLHRHNHPGQLADALRRADHPSKETYRLS
jgi:hypothetical protein